MYCLYMFPETKTDVVGIMRKLLITGFMSV